MRHTLKISATLGLLIVSTAYARPLTEEEVKDFPSLPSAPRPPSAPGDWHCEKPPPNPQNKWPPDSVPLPSYVPDVAQEKWDYFQKLMPCPDEACRRAGFPACMLAKG